MEFKKNVKYRLIDLGKTQKWLEEQVREETGLFVDSSYLAKIFSGERNAPKIKSAICKILNIKEQS